MLWNRNPVLNPYFQFFMNRSCKEREKINRIGADPLEYTGFISQNKNSKLNRRERRRSTVIDKVKEISGLDTFE